MKKYISSAAFCWYSPVQHELLLGSTRLMNKQPCNKEAKITMAQAKKAVLAKEPGTIKSIERENQKLIYSFDIQTKSGIHEVNVDAISGDVVEDKAESAAAEAKEKQKDKKHSHPATSTPANDKNDK